MMIYILIFGVIAFTYFLLHRFISRTIKYQNLKNNVTLRLIFEKEFKECDWLEKEFYTSDDADEKRMRMDQKNDVLYKIEERINSAIDEELDNDGEWKDALTALIIEAKYYHFENSIPFTKLFGTDAINRFRERNSKLK